MSEIKMHCPTHPEREFPVHFTYCDLCGQPLMAQAVPRSRCPRCQADVKEGMQFCQACGFKLIEEPEAEQPPTEQRAMRLEQAGLSESSLSAPSPQPSLLSTSSEKKVVTRSCHKCSAPIGPGLKFCEVCGAPMGAAPKRLIAAAASLVLVIGVGIAGWYGYQYYRQRQVSTATQSAEKASEVTSGQTAQGPQGSTTEESSVTTGETSTGNVNKNESGPSGNTHSGPTTVVLTILSTPPDCQVYLDGRPQDQTDSTGRLEIPNVPPGQHTISLHREGYLESSRVVKLSSSMNAPIQFQLKLPPPVTLTVATLSGSEVYLDNRPVGTTDANGQVVIPNVKQGSHSVRVSRAGYEDSVQSTTLNSDWTLNAPLKKLSYDGRLKIARNHTSAGRTNEALSLLQELADEEPNRPEAYELSGKIYYDQNRFSQARGMMERAIKLGGRAEFSVTHDHQGGPSPVDQTKREWRDYCNGELIITSGRLQFRTGDPGDGFTVTRPEIREARMNAMVGSEIAAFHIKIRSGGPERNFNFAPRTKRLEESRMILDLISAYVH